MKGSETKHGTTDENNKKKTNQFFKKEQRERDTICWWRSRRRQNVSDSFRFYSFLFDYSFSNLSPVLEEKNGRI